jgi:hypothetical protein
MNLILGKTVTDRITGFTGTVVGHVEYLTGCNQALVVPKVDKDGKLQEGQWFDDQRLQLSEGAPVKLDNSSTPGCDAAPPRNY